MDESESNGTAKGSLKDRLHILAILMRISRQKKLRLKFKNINYKKIFSIKRFFLRFYNPAKIVLDDNTKVDNAILYDRATNNDKFALKKSGTDKIVEPTIIRKVTKRKGIGEEKTKLSELKKEISSNYEVKEEKIDLVLIHDYYLIKNNAKELFDANVDEETKKELIIDRIKADSTLNLIRDVTEEKKDSYLDKDIKYDISVNAKNFGKLDKLLEKEKKELERISRKIDEFDINIERKLKITNMGSLLDNTIGIGIGLLTLPFSFSKTLALGTNLIRKSINRIHEDVKLDVVERKVKDYKVSTKDIMTTEKALKTSDFLLEDVLDKLDHLKYKIRLQDYKIPDVQKKLKEIEALESGLAKKKRDLKKLVESFEKNKVKVLNRDNKEKKE